MQGVDVVQWVNYIMEKFRKNNQFTNSVYSDDEYVKDGKYVVIPQAGDDPTTTKNRTIFPAPVTLRKDRSVVYQLDVYRTDPTLITAAETYEVSYNKMDSVYGSHADKLVQDAADDLIIKWLDELPQVNYIPTVGPNTSVILTGATGTRKTMTYELLKQVKRRMDLDDVPMQGRTVLISPNHLDELITSFTPQNFDLFSKGYDPTTGMLGNIFGFSFYMRSSTARASFSASTYTVKPYKSANAAGDREVTLVYQKDAITKAMGTVDFFEDTEGATTYGDTYSAQMYCGGRRRRDDNKGVYAIVQDLGV